MDIVRTNIKLEMLTWVMQMKLLMYKIIRRVYHNAISIIFHAYILGRISPNVERNLSNYQKVFADLDQLQGGLDILSLIQRVINNSCSID